MKSRLWFCLLILLNISQVACSKQWRENNIAISSEEVLSDLDFVTGSSAGSGGNFEEFVSIATSPGTTIYYASSPKMGPVATVASIFDFSFMIDYFTLVDVSEIRVFFLDYKDEGGHHNALMVDANLTDNTSVTDVFWGDGRVESGQFVADMVSDDGAAGLIVKSNDVSKSGDLNGTIQLKSYLPSGTYIGKFSTLIGFQ